MKDVKQDYVAQYFQERLIFIIFSHNQKNKGMIEPIRDTQTPQINLAALKLRHSKITYEYDA